MFEELDDLLPCPYHSECVGIVKAEGKRKNGIPTDCYKDFMSCPLYAIYEESELDDEEIIKKLKIG